VGVIAAGAVAVAMHQGGGPGFFDSLKILVFAPEP
jgi:hypothetical protein